MCVMKNHSVTKTIDCKQTDLANILKTHMCECGCCIHPSSVTYFTSSLTTEVAALVKST